MQPRAKRNAIIGTVGDALKIAITAPPVEGRANEAVIEFFSDLLKVPRTAVTILSGFQSRNKTVRIGGITRSEMLARLHSEFQFENSTIESAAGPDGRNPQGLRKVRTP